MPAKRRENVSLKKNPTFKVTRVSGDDRLVYVMVDDMKFNLSNHRSRIAYIGTIKKGIIVSRLGRQGVRITFSAYMESSLSKFASFRVTGAGV